MAYEVDYIPVGEGGKSGDAICLRYGNLTGPRSEQTIVIIDGGDKVAGEKIVQHLNEFYSPNGYIDYVISTHPDSDHSSGLRIVLEEFHVRNLLMHQPWNHASDIRNYFSDGRWTIKGLGATIRNAMRYVKQLEIIANRKSTKIIEPFAGYRTPDGVMTVLGPSREFYQECLPNFRMTPKSKIGIGLIGTLIKKAEEVVNFIEDRFDIDILNDDEDTTSFENNTSTILMFNIDEHRLLFTGDAGKTALLKAVDYADSINLPLTNLEFLDVPHHGSRRNLSSRVLARINARTALISASGENPKHPSKRVVNALQKFGATEVTVIRKLPVLFNHEANHRGWYAPAPQEPFHSQVEE